LRLFVEWKKVAIRKILHFPPNYLNFWVFFVLIIIIIVIMIVFHLCLWPGPACDELD
jgi:hypothetical protein